MSPVTSVDGREDWLGSLVQLRKRQTEAAQTEAGLRHDLERYLGKIVRFHYAIDPPTQYQRDAVSKRALGRDEEWKAAGIHPTSADIGLGTGLVTNVDVSGGDAYVMFVIPGLSFEYRVDLGFFYLQRLERFPHD